MQFPFDVTKTLHFKARDSLGFLEKKKRNRPWEGVILVLFEKAILRKERGGGYMRG